MISDLLTSIGSVEALHAADTGQQVADHLCRVELEALAIQLILIQSRWRRFPTPTFGIHWL